MLLKTVTLLLSITSLSLVSCSSQSGNVDHSSTTSSVNTSESSLEKRVIYYTNIERAKYGLNPVSAHKGIAKVARKHSDFTARNEGKFGLHNTSVTHMGFSGRSKMVRAAYNVGNVAENVHTTWAKDGDIAKRIVSGWMNSPGHRKTMLGKSFRYCGVGIRQKGTGTFSTMLMATPGHSAPKLIGPQGW